jgi:peptide-methionine (R)-S-oxide reductase
MRPPSPRLPSGLSPSWPSLGGSLRGPLAGVLRPLLLACLVVGAALSLLWPNPAASGDVPTTVAASHLSGVQTDQVDWKAKSDDWWKQTLPAATYAVCREGGTERAFTGALLDEKHPGVFVCQSCGHELFRSEHKFKSGTGWPSFSDVAAQGAVRSIRDSSLGMVRTEVRCGRCDAHLGHVFDDGPPPTDLRYCINSVCMLHVPAAATRVVTPSATPDAAPALGEGEK